MVLVSVGACPSAGPVKVGIASVGVDLATGAEVVSGIMNASRGWEYQAGGIL